jgi:integrase
MVTRRSLGKGVTLVKRGESWHLEVFKVGKWALRRSMNTGDSTVAEERARVILAGNTPTVPMIRQTPKPDALTLDKALEEYEIWYEAKRKASTVAVSLPIVRSFIHRVGAESDTRAVTQKHVQSYIDSRVDDECCYWTIKNDFGRVRAFLKWIEKRHNGAVDLHCVRGIEFPKDNSVTPEAPSMDMLNTIFRKIHNHPTLYDVCRCLLDIGCRPGELLALRGIDIEGNIIKIRPHDEWSPKSKWSVRTIQITNEAAAILNGRKERLFNKTALLFGLESGKMRNAKYTGSMYRDALRDDDGEMLPEFKNCDLYSFRHAFATLHAAPGPAFMELQKLAAYMGHGPGSTHLLERFYADRNAMRAGAPPSLLGEEKDGKLVSMQGAKE